MDLSSLDAEQEAPEAAVFRLTFFRWRFGKLIDNDGKFSGVTLEIYATPIPWLKLRFPFLRKEIFVFHETLGRLLEDESPEETAA